MELPHMLGLVGVARLDVALGMPRQPG